jgi:release factor glutamine methyltransferase
MRIATMRLTGIIRAVPTAGEVLREAERRLKASEAIDHPHAGKERLEVEEMLEFVVGEELDPDDEVPTGALARFRRLLARREEGEPVAYLLRRTTFKDLTLEVTPGAFIPRESSEFMADQAIRRLRGRPKPVHIDLATGIGPVALAVAHALRRAKVFGVDISARPVALARRNAKLLKLRNTTFMRGDLFGPLPRTLAGTVDVITFHPPYVPRREMRTLPEEILRFEPAESLTDGSITGLRLLERAADEAPGWLRSGGWLLVEVSPDRTREVATVLRHAGFRDVRGTKGSLSFSRVVVGRLPGTR